MKQHSKATRTGVPPLPILCATRSIEKEPAIARGLCAADGAGGNADTDCNMCLCSERNPFGLPSNVTGGYFSAAALDLRPTSSGFKPQYRWFAPCQGELLEMPWRQRCNAPN